MASSSDLPVVEKWNIVADFVANVQELLSKTDRVLAVLAEPLPLQIH